MGIQNVIDAGGFSLSLLGVSIVFFALVSLATFIHLLPKILAKLEPFLPEVQEEKSRAQKGEDLAVVAAIAYALHHSKRDKN